MEYMEHNGVYNTNEWKISGMSVFSTSSALAKKSCVSDVGVYLRRGLMGTSRSMGLWGE